MEVFLLLLVQELLQVHRLHLVGVLLLREGDRVLHVETGIAMVTKNEGSRRKYRHECRQTLHEASPLKMARGATSIIFLSDSTDGRSLIPCSVNDLTPLCHIRGTHSTHILKGGHSLPAVGTTAYASARFR